MTSAPASLSYNERLFGAGLRGRLHFARFHALTRAIREYAIDARRVIELGCYDGKTIRFFTELPQRYVGLDADWEGGLHLARATWCGQPAFEFRHCERPTDIPQEETFGLAICMETLEHVPSADVDLYLEGLARVTRGHVFISVPNEKGPVFFVKHLLKRFVVGHAENYTFMEFVNASMGRMSGVRRREHKGFDYATIVAAVGRHFDVVAVRGIPFYLPPLFAFGVMIVARSRESAGSPSRAS